MGSEMCIRDRYGTCGNVIFCGENKVEHATLGVTCPEKPKIRRKSDRSVVVIINSANGEG